MKERNSHKYLELLKAPSYYDALLDSIKKTKSHIVICAMTVDSGPRIEALFRQLTIALNRGVNVTLLFDGYGFSRFSEEGFLRHAQHQQTMTALKSLENLGAKIVIVGKVGHNPFAGRMHIKASIIDDTVYAFGGINLKESALLHRDFMLRTVDSKLSAVLVQITDQLAAEDMLPDRENRLGNDSTLLLDNGQRGHSIIYDKACELAASSKEVYYVSRMCPSGRLAQLIKQTHYHCYFNRPSLAKFPTNISIVLDQISYNIRNLYDGDNYIHAKYMLFVHKNGKKSLLTGSHNFNWRGVTYGTKEMALYSTDEQLWQSLYKFTETLDN